MEIVDVATPLGQKLVPGAKLPIAVLAAPDGTLIGKAENKDGYLRVYQVEKLVDDEYKRRENLVDSQLRDAKEHVKSGDNAGAIPIYKAVLGQKCLFPRKAKEAAKALKKLGVEEAAGLADAPDFPAPIFDRVVGAKIERTMKQGLRAENSAHYREADACMRWPTAWIRQIQRPCDIWAKSTGTRLATGRKHVRRSMQFWRCRLIRSLVPSPCTATAR
jgi:hypothetical protein